MATDRGTRRYRRWYARLIRLYPRAHREQFGESMAQTFADLCHERREAGRDMTGFLLSTFVDTSTGILRENFTVMIARNRSLRRATIGSCAILLVPLILTLSNPHARIHGGNGGGWDWMPASFVVMGAMLFTTALALDFAIRKVSSPVFRSAACVFVVIALLAVWGELSVDAVSQTIRLIAQA